MSALELTSSERRALRARAHALDPVVIVGGAGLTAGVAREIDRALAAHELVKIRVPAADRDERDALLGRICDELAAAPVQHIGKILVVYRPLPPEAAAARAAPRPAPRPARKGPRRTKKSYQD
jgi:putative YhbY family RNA-binding protein